MRILVAWLWFSVRGGFGRFFNLYRYFLDQDIHLDFLSLNNRVDNPWKTFPGEIINWKTALTRRYSAVMVPDIGAPDKVWNKEKFRKLKRPRFGKVILHILSHPTRLKAYEHFNRIIEPDIIIINNSQWKPHHLQNLNADSIHILPGYVNTGIFYPDKNRDQSPQKLTWQLGGYVFKNPEPLLKTMLLLPDNFILHLFGRIPEGFDELITRLVKIGRVKYHGIIFGEDLARFYRSLDMFINTETIAGWCNSAAEAMACGIPTILTKNGTVDFAKPRVNCLQLDRITPDEICRNINRLIKNPELRRNLAWEGIQTLQQFTLPSYADSMLRIINQTPRQPHTLKTLLKTIHLYLQGWT